MNPCELTPEMITAVLIHPGINYILFPQLSCLGQVLFPKNRLNWDATKTCQWTSSHQLFCWAVEKVKDVSLEKTFPEADEVLSECAKRVHGEEKLPEKLRKTRFRWAPAPACSLTLLTWSTPNIFILRHLNRFRLTSLPDFPEFNRKTVPGSEDVGRILAIRYVEGLNNNEHHR